MAEFHRQKAWGWDSTAKVLSIPIRATALFVMRGESSKIRDGFLKGIDKSPLSIGWSASGIVLIVMELAVARRKYTSMAQWVHRSAFLGMESL